MKIFITGVSKDGKSSGFIGSRIVKVLDRHKIPWVGYDLHDGNDIRDSFRLAKSLHEAQPTAVLHLAARAGAKLGEKYPIEYYETNVIGTQTVVRCTEEYGANVLVHFSSSSVLGGCEADSEGLGVDAAYDPRNVYGLTKMTGEMIVKNAKGIPLRAVVRPFSVYGKNSRPDMVIGRWLDAVKRNRPITVYGKGGAIRGYTLVDDVSAWTVDVLTGAFLHDGGCKILHFGGSDKVTLDRLAKVFTEAANEAGYDVKVRSEDRQDWDIKNSFSAPMPKEFTDWAHKSQADFDETVRRIVLDELKV